MPESINSKGYAYNQTRQAFLAQELRVADTHWSRLRGLMGSAQESFTAGHGLWIVPCHGVHTLMMRYSIDVVYLSEQNEVVQIEENVKPWRMTPMNMDAVTVLELPAHTVWNTGTKVGDQLEMVRDRRPQAAA